MLSIMPHRFSVRSRAVCLTLTVGLAASLSSARPAIGQGHPPMMRPVVQPLTLSEGQVTGFLSAVEELKTLSGKQAGWKGADPSNPMAMAGALESSSETIAILHKHGFKDTSDFQRVAYNAAMAYAIVQDGGKAAVQKRYDQSKAEQDKAMEQMRAKLSPEQAAAIAAQMQSAMKMAPNPKDVPDGNIELMTKYQDRMAKLSAK